MKKWRNMLKSKKNFFLSLVNKAHELNHANILSLLERNADAALLDLGCSDGNWTMAVAQKIGTNDIHGIEIYGNNAKIANSKGIRVYQGDLNDPFPLDSSSIDVIHANQVIEHVASIDNFLSEIKRVLKPQGYAVVSTENGSSWHNIIASIMGWQTFSSANIIAHVKDGIGNPLASCRGQEGLYPASWAHKVIFNYLGLLETFEAYGFENVEILSAGYHPFSPKLALIDKRHGHFITIKAYKPTDGDPVRN